MLLMPQYRKPVDMAQDILDRGFIPFVYSEYLEDVLIQSSNPTYQKLGEYVENCNDDYDYYMKIWKRMFRVQILVFF